MSELKAYRFLGQDEVWPDANLGSDYYLKSEVDKVIAEKDAEIARLKAIRKVHIKAIESMGAGLQQDGVEIRRLRRALWLARAERADDRAITCNDFAYLGDTEREINMALARTWMNCRLLKPSEWSKVWDNVKRKCLKKAEEYK